MKRPNRFNRSDSDTGRHRPIRDFGCRASIADIPDDEVINSQAESDTLASATITITMYTLSDG